MMIFVNEVEKFNISRERFEKFLMLLAPFAPHICEEIWHENLGNKNSIFLEKWPKYDPKLIKDEEAIIVVQINGKMRDQLRLAAGASEEEMKKRALESPKIKKYTESKNIRKIIFVKDRIINLVV
ncbi:MAG: hypothetical protein A2095_14120 [Sphingomonadales bacterium GWF1_63_6]|nr:MAG: hypothetical protein A2095_14120 [Sphingomonadales bacterium GWF1_63_6]